MQEPPVPVAGLAEGPARVSGTGGTRPARATEDSGTDREASLERSLEHVNLRLRKFKDVKKLRFSGKVTTEWIPEA